MINNIPINKIPSMNNEVKMFTQAQRERMANIVNDALQLSEFAAFTNSVTFDSFNADDSKPLILWKTIDGSINGADIFPKLFASIAVNRKSDEGQFYHFKRLDLVKSILQNDEIQFSSLESLNKNDHAEYSEFFRRMGYSRPLESVGIKKSRVNRFVLCMSKNSKEERFWKDYADNEYGGCIAMRFVVTNDPDWRSIFEFRDIVYDDGYRFDFMNDIRYWFQHDFQKDLFMEGITKLSLFYKRKKYEWENETRLAFNYEQYPNINRTFPVTENGGRIYITVPFDNPFFKIQVDEVVLGKSVSDADMAFIQALGKTKSFRVWRRK